MTKIKDLPHRYYNSVVTVKFKTGKQVNIDLEVWATGSQHANFIAERYVEMVAKEWDGPVTTSIKARSLLSNIKAIISEETIQTMINEKEEAKKISRKKKATTD